MMSKTARKIPLFLRWSGTILFQLVMSQIVTFIFSLLFVNLERFQQTFPLLFGAFLVFTFSSGVFLVGGLAIKTGWLPLKHMLFTRLVYSMLGALLPIIAALILYRTLEPGNPFFMVSILLSILAFYLPELLHRREN